ncbi:MAG: PhnD/SsuA/transferrin family substrate-binding protein [Gammaproteobacteria bacterium]|nr:PhnD/SsuA/transferrin family substrate-binding protein [Gammaproteobacteria bacterium]
MKITALIKQFDWRTAKQPITRLLGIAILSCLPTSLIMADNATPTQTNNHQEIRVVMSAAFVSDTGIKVYDDIFHYLGEKLGQKVVFISGFSYSTINNMLDSGMADIGFICGLPYVIKHDQPQPAIELLLAPIMKDAKYKNKPIYYSYIIAHKDSRFERFADTRGSRFVFNDEISNSGYNMPRAHLIDSGETSGFFGETIRSGSHEESIRMVALGKADISAVDSLVYDYDLINNPAHVKQTKIIKTLGPAGIPPIVVSAQTPLGLRQKIRDILIEMKNDAVGRAILDRALVDRFAPVDDSNYDSIRHMQKQAKDSGYQVIH